MRYEAFREKVEAYPVFGDWIFEIIAEDSKVLRNCITEWVKKGLVIRLKQGLYTLRNKDRRKKTSLDYLANQIYSPSYISLEYALQHYNFIPEAVYLVTSVTSKKTNNFNNTLGRFSYSHVKQEVFSDYVLKKDIYDDEYYIASPEKALLDFLYLRVRHIKNIRENIFDESYRLQNLDDIDCDKLMSSSQNYRLKTMSTLTSMLVDYIKKEWQ